MADVIYRNIDDMRDAIADLKAKATEFSEQSQFPGGADTNPTYSQSDTVTAMKHIDTTCHRAFVNWSATADSLAKFLENDVLIIEEADQANSD